MQVDSPLAHGFPFILLQERPASYPKLNFVAADLRGRFRKQLELETSDTVTIDSVEAAKPLTARAVRAVMVTCALAQRGLSILLPSLVLLLSRGP